MTEHLRRDDDNRSEEANISDYTELNTFCHKLIISSFYNINLL